MPAIIFFITAVVILIAVFSNWIVGYEKKKAFLTAFAKKHALKFKEDFNHRLEGTISGYNIFMEISEKRKKEIISITLYYEINDVINLHLREDVFKNEKGGFVNKGFIPDDLSIVKRSCHNMTGYLCADLRNKIRDLYVIASEVEITEKFIKVSRIFIQDNDYIAKTFDMMTEIAGVLNGGESLKDRFINNIKIENNIDIRIMNIDHYAEKYGIDGMIKPLLIGLLDHSSFDLRFACASYLGKKGLKYLSDLLTDKDKLPALDDMIRIVRILKKEAFRESIGSLLALYAWTYNAGLKIEILDAFRIFGSEDLNDFFVSQLDLADDKAKLCIVKALGTCGSFKALGILNDMSASLKHRLTDIGFELEDTIAKIQKRSGGDKGGLSISESNCTDGALSVQEQYPGGELSKT